MLIPQIQGGISRRKKFELNLANVDTWLKTTESELAESISLDVDVAIIAMLVNKYEVWTSFKHNTMNYFCYCF